MTAPKAPPAPEPESNTGSQAPFLKLDPPPESDAWPAVLVGYDYLEAYEQEFQGQKKVSDCVVLYFGGVYKDEQGIVHTWLVKSWPMTYSVYEKARYARWIGAMTGAMPSGGTVPDDFIGGECLCEIEVVDKVSKKGTAYRAARLKNVSKLPSAMKGAVLGQASLMELQGVLEQARSAAASYKKDDQQSQPQASAKPQQSNNQSLAAQMEGGDAVDLEEDVPF